ncbi:low temperature requirement protein A [Micromonospora zamorensis]|uniref:Low temperature requirement protein A n=1 Tax=Micromonospora zamorensis TaxID=709883 RepID=A0ABZ1PDP2_9ACTN
MRGIFDERPVRAAETHRTTMFEIFFDLVFVFALTRVITFMAGSPTALILAQGLLLLLLLLYSWGPYTWVGNLVRADVGLVRAATLVAMAAIFVVALVLPDAWKQGPGLLDAPLALALAYVVGRAVQLVVLFWVSATNPPLRSTLRFFTVPVVLAWLPLVGGALLGLTSTVCLWWLYFDRLAPAARKAVSDVPDERRAGVAGDAYGIGHSPLIIGAIYVALGIEEVISQLSEESGHSDPLGWEAATALYGGAAVYLISRLVFRRLTVRVVHPTQVVAALLPLALLPIGRSLPPLAALALLTVFLIGVTWFEQRVDQRDWAQPRHA